MPCIVESDPALHLPRAFLAAVYADLGRLDEAQATASDLMRLEPTFIASRLLKSHTFHDPAKDARFIGLMHDAGLPEGPILSESQ